MIQFLNQSAIFVGTACPGGDRGCQRSQRIFIHVTFRLFKLHKPGSMKYWMPDQVRHDKNLLKINCCKINVKCL